MCVKWWNQKRETEIIPGTSLHSYPDSWQRDIQLQFPGLDFSSVVCMRNSNEMEQLENFVSVQFV